MKGLIIPNRDLRILSGQLQNFKQGYSIAEIRLLDRVVKNVELVLAPFNMELKSVLVQEFKTPEEKDIFLVEFMESKGKETITFSLEEPDYEFIKLMWSRMANLSGSPEAREAVLSIDDAIKNATEPTFK